MEVTLIVVTMLSLALAIGMSIVAWRLLQEERQRAAARVALLEEGLAASLAANPPAAAAAVPAPALADAVSAAESAALASDASSATAAASAAAAPATPSATRLLDLDAADEPDWLAQFPSSKGTMNGWTPSTVPLAHLNGTVAGFEESDASHEDGSGVRWSHTRNGATPEKHAAIDAAPGGAAAVADSHVADDTSPLHELPAQTRHPLDPPDALGEAELLGAADAAALMPKSAAGAHRLFVDADADADADTAAAAEHGRAYAGASGARRPLLALGIGAAVMVVAMLALWAVGRLMLPAWTSPNAHQQPVASASPSASGPASPASAAASANGAPLELVALKQVRDGDALTISGVVRNPHEGAPVERIAAVILFFDGAGAQLTSVRAPLDFRTLAPGDESPFQVTTTVPAGVSRYRVSFRRDEGTIVPHVDRRTQETS